MVVGIPKPPLNMMREVGGDWIAGSWSGWRKLEEVRGRIMVESEVNVGDVEGDALEPGQTAFVQALLTARTVEEAAERAEVSRRTGHRWLAEPAVQTVLRRTQDELLQHVARKLVAGATEAADTLRAIHSDPKTPPAVRVSAARICLELGQRFIETAYLANRVAALEREREEAGHDHTPAQN